MDTDRLLELHHQSIQNLETAVRDLSMRMGKVEDKADSAWHRIRETQQDISDLYDKVDELDQNVKTIMATQVSMDSRMGKLETGMEAVKTDNTEIKQDGKISKSQLRFIITVLKVLLIAVGVLLAVNVAFFIYTWLHNPELAKEMLSFGSDVAKAVT